MGNTFQTGNTADTTYQLGEVNTGKTWIDGKPIYRSVFRLSVNNNTGGPIVVPLANIAISELIDQGGSLHRTTSQNDIIPVLASAYVRVVRPDNLHYYLGSSMAGTLTVWVEYTKV